MGYSSAGIPVCRLFISFAYTSAIYNAYALSHSLASRRLHGWQLSALLRCAFVASPCPHLFKVELLDFFELRVVGLLINRFNSDLFVGE